MFQAKLKNYKSWNPLTPKGLDRQALSAISMSSYRYKSRGVEHGKRKRQRLEKLGYRKVPDILCGGSKSWRIELKLQNQWKLHEA